MDLMKNIINRLKFLLYEVPEKLSNLSGNELSLKPHEDKWSKKEIIGHLCDSAINNLSRFVRGQFEKQPFKVISYNQDKWVKVNHYNEIKIEEIINYWRSLNRQIINVITNIPEDKLAVVCNLGNAAFREVETDKTLLWLIEDYLFHIEYHLRQVVGEL